MSHGKQEALSVALLCPDYLVTLARPSSLWISIPTLPGPFTDTCLMLSPVASSFSGHTSYLKDLTLFQLQIPSSH